LAINPGECRRLAKASNPATARARPEPTELRQALAAFTDQGNKIFVPFFQGLLAGIEA